MLRTVLAVALLGGALGSPSVPVYRPEETPDQTAVETGRQSSSSTNWFGNGFNDAIRVLFSANELDPLYCATTDSKDFGEGLCLRVTDCIYNNGENFGTCGGGVGACCVFKKTCQQTSSMYVTHFKNPETFSERDRGTGECKLSVYPMNDNICQYRIDFLEFEIIGPDSNSVCVDDFMGVSGGTPVPKLCGNLTSQHLYVNVKPSSGPIVVTIDTSSVRSYARKWNIRVEQISCSSPTRAPSGCLQFFNETSGTVRSFNFQAINSPTEDVHHQIQNSHYGVCINSKVGYCSLTWTMGGTNDYTFTVSGDAAVDRSSLEPRMGTTECTKDYITIPGGTIEDKDTKKVIPAERFCGTHFPEVKTSAQPYVLHVINNADEEEDDANLGFELNFRLNLCYA